MIRFLRLGRNLLWGALVSGAVVSSAGVGIAGTLIYTPVNPSFGGNPNNGPNLLNLANAQNLPLAQQTAAQAAAAAAAANGGGTGSSAALTPGQIFAQQLQSQLLSSFANQITQSIFGANAQTSGNFSFGTTSISFARVANQINISVNDGTSITNIVVPANP